MAEGKGSILSELLELNNSMLSGKDYNLVIKEILDFAQNLCKADGCFLYSVNTEDFMSLEFSRINTVGLNKIGSDNLKRIVITLSLRKLTTSTTICRFRACRCRS